MRRIMVGTPATDGKLECHYVSSLNRTIKDCLNFGIEVCPIFIAYDSLLVRARSDVMYFAHEGDIESMVFIDSDVGWQTEDFLKLVMRDEDVVAGTYPLKHDKEFYPLRAVNSENPKLVRNENGLCEILGVGAGFIKLSKKAIDALWNSSTPHTDENGIEKRMVFDVSIKNGKLMSEDILLCQKLVDLGFKIWLDPSINLSHTGAKTYTGNFEQWARAHNFLE